jgi:hypothetical protein
LAAAWVAFLVLNMSSSSQNEEQTTFQGEEYEKQSASEKAKQILAAIRADRVQGSYLPPRTVSELLANQSMNTTFETAADEFPKQGDGYRRKLIHSVAAIGIGKWIPVPNNLGYTGIFADGCDNLVLRMSSGYEPIVNDKPTNHIMGGLTLKFLRDGMPSVNIFAVHSLTGQPSYNYFQHDISNHVADFHHLAGPELLKSRANFARGSPWPVMQGLNTVAGSETVSTPRFPFRVIFHPETHLHKGFPDAYTGVSLFKQLSDGVKPGPVYKVYAIQTPADDVNLDKAVHIANIVLTTDLTTSTFGDTKLFFRHVRFDDDLKYYPEWEEPTRKILADQLARDTAFVYPDLPFQ